jgi:hypothetical protein
MQPIPTPIILAITFWGRDGSPEDAVHCHEGGRKLVNQCRRLLIERKLIAIGTRQDGAREMIRLIEWADAAERSTVSPSFFHSFMELKVVKREEMLTRSRRTVAVRR